MVTTTKLYTADDLWVMPTDEPWEIWRGELIEVPFSGMESSAVGYQVGHKVASYVAEYDLGVVTGEAGGYILFPDRRTVVMPDIGFIRWERLPDRRLPRKFCPVPPDLAVEVTSPTDEPADMARKLALYLEAGVPLVWWLDPDRRRVRVYHRGQFAAEHHEGDVLDGLDILPGFRLPVADIFR
jgi:Uma2 family endonuclease